MGNSIACSNCGQKMELSAEFLRKIEARLRKESTERSVIERAKRKAKALAQLKQLRLTPERQRHLLKMQLATTRDKIKTGSYTKAHLPDMMKKIQYLEEQLKVTDDKHK